MRILGLLLIAIGGVILGFGMIGLNAFLNLHGCTSVQCLGGQYQYYYWLDIYLGFSFIVAGTGLFVASESMLINQELASSLRK